MQEIEVLLSIIATVAGGAVLGYWGWIGVRVVDQGRKIADLEARMCANDHLHTELSLWLRSMDTKLTDVRETVSGLREAFKHFGIERRGATSNRSEKNDSKTKRVAQKRGAGRGSRG